MKKHLFSLFVFGVFVCSSLTYAQTNKVVKNSSYDQEFLDAHARMYTQGMTKYEQVTDFQPESWVTRQEAAKFFVGFDRVVMGREAETMMYCVYSDEASFDPTLAGAIQSACNRNLMRGAEGKFDAQAYLTKAQALAILIRSLLEAQDEQIAPRRTNYFIVAQKENLTKESNVKALDRPLTRYELALLLWRVEHPLFENSMGDVYGLLQELGLQTQ